jgi:hypothetical protein
VLVLERDQDRFLDPEGVVYDDHSWWSAIKLEFVLNHLEPWWNIAPADSLCPVPFSCEAHYERVQYFVWRIGEVLKCYQRLSPAIRKSEFSAFEASFDEFHQSWLESATSDAERRLPDSMISDWWRLFGGNSSMQN